MLIEYVRDKKRRPVGVVVATGKHQIGWSKCNRLDEWDRQKALMIAKNRANAGMERDVFANAPYDIMTAVEKMEDRALKYYQ